MLNLAGVVSTAKLRSWRRAEIFLVFLFAAIVTPSQDPFTMLALGLPMVLLYEVALLVGWLNDRRKARRGDTSPYADLADDETSPLDFDDDPRPAPPRPAAPAQRAEPVGAAAPVPQADAASGDGTHDDIT
jgi:sec-independent protein translocase protein TatC